MDEAQDQSARSAGGFLRRHRSVLLIGAHVLLFALSLLLSFGLAYNFKLRPPWLFTKFLPVLPVVVAIKVLVFGFLRLYRGWWRYVGLRDALTVIKASHISTLIFVLIYYLAANLWRHLIPVTDFWADFFAELFQGFPTQVFLLDWAGTIALVTGVRISVRLYYEELRPVAAEGVSRMLILGAGNAAESIVREILRLPVQRYQIVGLLDDDPTKHGARIHDVEVLGPVADVGRVCKDKQVDEILIAMPSASREQMRRIVELCGEVDVRFRTIPGVEDLIDGRVTIGQIREVDIRDLLGREQVELDTAAIAAFIRSKVVMVTGAGGSIGSEMCRQVLRFAPTHLVLVEQAENNLFEIHQELIPAARASGVRLTPCVADICDKARIEAIFAEHPPSAVFHAAAHKHVPMMEWNIPEAIKNNVLGTRTVADAAVAAGVAKFVMISTDKAVNPTSIMGCTKRVAEMYIQQLSERSKTPFVTVRFGNVLGSSGSVIPTFKRQIAAGGPVTVTHPDMTRYFMTIPEASQLVLQAGAMGSGGEIFVLDMGEPVKIVDLARDLITLSGFRPGEDIEIAFTGVRPGEKLFEELMIAGEDVARTRHPKIGVWRRRGEDWEQTCQGIDSLLAMADTASEDEIRATLKRLVPEYQVDYKAPAFQPAAGSATKAPEPASPTQA